MDKTDALRNVRLYRWYKMLLEPLFWGPVLVISLQRLGGMSLESIYFCEAVVLFGFVFLEVPSGALADMIGRKRTVAIGGVLHLVAMVWFALMRSPFDAWGANLAWMLGAALRSGADTSLLYDSLKAADAEKEYRSIEGHAQGRRMFLFAMSSLVTGGLAELDLRYPLLLCIPGVAVAAVISFMFREPPRDEDEEPDSFAKHRRLIATSFRFASGSAAVCWVIGFSTLVGVVSKLWFFTYNPYFEEVGLAPWQMGAAFFLLNIVAWLSSRYAAELEAKVGEARTVLFSVALLGVPMLVMGLFPGVVGASMVLAQNVVRGASVPLTSAFLNDRTASRHRATVNSIQSTANGVAQFVGLYAFGLVVGAFPLPHSLVLLGTVTLACGAASFAQYLRLPR